MAKSKTKKPAERDLTDLEKAAIQPDIEEYTRLGQQIEALQKQRQAVFARMNRIAALIEPDEGFRVRLDTLKVERVPAEDEDAD